MNENETNTISKMSIKVIGGGVYLKNKPQTITITWEIKDENGNIITPDTLSVNNIPLDPTTTSKTYHRVFSDVDFTVRAVKDGVLAIGTTTARFVGPTQTVEDSLTSNSRSIAASANSVRLLNEKIENNNSFKGLFTSLDDLKKKFRSGNNGDWAIVGEGIPAPIYIWNKNGWEATGGQYTGSTIDLDSYYTKEDVANYTDDYNVSKNHSHIVKIYDLVNWKVVERKPDAPVFQLGQSYDASEVVNMTDDNDSSYECLQATITAPYLSQEVRSFTLAEAISFLPEDLRVTGQKISFLSSELNAWMTYVFTGGDYTNPTYWEIFTNNIDPDTNQKIADLQAKDKDLQNQINEDVTNLNNHIAESDAKFEEIDNTLTKHEDRMDDIEDEILLSSVEAACAPKDVEILADRAYKDHLGNIIADEYITRDTLTEEIIDITNQQVTDLKPGSVQPEDLSEAVKQMIGCKKITNLPDEEDITVTEDNTLKFKDREYSPKDYSGMGKKILRKHYIDGVNTLTQHMINKPNTIYVIRYDYCLQGQTIEIPENCVLEFDGGSLNNGEIVFNNTELSGLVKIYTKVSGNISNNIVKVSWFSADKDITKSLKDAVNIIVSGEIQIDIPNAEIKDTINIVKSNIIINGLNNDININVNDRISAIQIGNPIQDLSAWKIQDYNVYQNIKELELDWVYDSTNNYFTTFLPGYNNVIINSITDNNGSVLTESDYTVEDYVIDNSYGKSDTVYKKYTITKTGYSNYDLFKVNLTANEKFTNQNYIYVSDKSSFKKNQKIIIANQYEFVNLQRAYYKVGEIVKIQGISDTTNDSGFYSIYSCNPLYGNYGDNTKIYIDINNIFIENITIKNLNLIGDYTANSLLEINKVDGLVLDNIKAIGGNTTGINCKLCYNLQLSNCDLLEAVDLNGDIEQNYSICFNGCNIVNITNSTFNGGRHCIDFGRGYVSPYYPTSEQSNIIATQSSFINISNCTFSNNSVKEVFDTVKASFMSHCAYNMIVSNCNFSSDAVFNIESLEISNCYFNRDTYIHSIRTALINNCEFNQLNLPEIYCKYTITDCKTTGNISTSGTVTAPNSNELLLAEINLHNVYCSANTFYNFNRKSFNVDSSDFGMFSVYGFNKYFSVKNCTGKYISSSYSDYTVISNNKLDQSYSDVESYGLQVRANNSVEVLNNTLVDVVPYTANISNVINSAIYTRINKDNGTIVVKDNVVLYTEDLNKQIDFEYYVLSGIVVDIFATNSESCTAIISNNHVNFSKTYSYHQQQSLRIAKNAMVLNSIESNFYLRNNYMNNSLICINEWMLPEVESDTNLYGTLYKPFGPVIYVVDEWRNIDSTLLSKVQIM